jgi:hypothetical protein
MYFLRAFLRRIRERNHALASGFAADHQELVALAESRHRQADEFGNAQTRGVKHLQQADEADALAAAAGGCRFDQRRDFGLAQCLRQGAALFRAFDRRGRVILADVLRNREAVELAQSRKAARNGAHGDLGFVVALAVNFFS